MSGIRGGHSLADPDGVPVVQVERVDGVPDPGLVRPGSVLGKTLDAFDETEITFREGDGRDGRRTVSLEQLENVVDLTVHTLIVRQPRSGNRQTVSWDA